MKKITKDLLGCLFTVIVSCSIGLLLFITIVYYLKPYFPEDKPPVCIKEVCGKSVSVYSNGKNGSVKVVYDNGTWDTKHVRNPGNSDLGIKYCKCLEFEH